MKCKKCGQIVKESDLYCDNCGEMINDINNNENKAMKIVLIILSEFILLSILLGSYILFVNRYVEKLNFNNFENVLKSRNYVIKDETKDYKKDGYIDKYYFCENNDKTMSFNYVLSTKKSDYMFESLKSQANSNLGNGLYKISNVDILNLYNYYSVEKNDKYYVVIKTYNTLFASGGTLEHKKEIKDIVNDLHLTYPKEVNYLLLGFIFSIFIIYIIVMWKIFVKAGKKGWKVLIPLYNDYCMSDIAFRKGWYFIFMIITPINFVFIPIWLYKIAKSFGKSTAFAICNILFPYITMQIIAFGNAKYIYKRNNQNDDNKIDDELIKYKNTNINEDNNFVSAEKQNIESKNNIEIYTKVTKIQNRNSILFCIGIFLYFLAFGWAMLYSDVEEEQYALLLIPMFVIALIATGLLVFCKVTNSKEGKIKYKYKNEKIYYFTILMFAISLFILFDGLTVFKVNFNVELAVWSIITGLAVSSLIYYFKSSSKLKTKLKKPVKITITILMLIIGSLWGAIVSDDSEELDIVNDYSKSSLVVYDKESTPFLLSKSSKGWFLAINEIGSSKMELSASSKPEELNIFYDVDNAAIRGLAGNDKIVVWSTETENKLTFFYYDIEENTNYELMTIEGAVENQNPRIELFNEKIYYEYINYANHKSEIHEYNTTTGEEKILKTYENEDDNLLYKIFMISNGNLFITNYNEITKIDIDNNYSENTIVLDSKVNNIYSVSYDKNYAIYYSNDVNEERIDIFDEKGKMKKHVYTFKNKHYAYYDKVIMNKGNIYWIDKGKSDDIVTNYNLSIYNIKSGKIQKVKKVFNYIIDDKVYGLGFYGNDVKNVRLYEIWY